MSGRNLLRSIVLGALTSVSACTNQSQEGTAARGGAAGDEPEVPPLLAPPTDLFLLSIDRGLRTGLTSDELLQLVTAKHVTITFAWESGSADCEEDFLCVCKKGKKSDEVCGTDLDKQCKADRQIARAEYATRCFRRK